MSLRDAGGSDILEQFKNTSNKVKKRFLRKPNLTEACDSFTNLAQQCESLELPAYAGLCWIATACCEGSLSNLPGETNCLLKAGRQFLKAEEIDHALGCPRPSSENLQAGLSCITHAIEKCGDSGPMNVGYNLEVVDFLNKIGQGEYSETYLHSAVNLSENRPDTKVYCLELLAKKFIENGDFVAALETYTEISKILENLPKSGSRSDLLLKCEINSVFLLLILKPSPQKLSSRSAKILVKYTWGDQSDSSLRACKMTEKMFLLMQSLVTICQSVDTSNLISLEGEFWNLLEKSEKELLRVLVQSYYP
ncbi:unnamed protein product [Brassicogethes aeneus]|uniref:Factor VIII intron 22 protein n=1 Tax=Brassicogethes aeneus TaxID=1431903 RepID=A0A9P0BJ83_BRAAE|nr:unnamed protein product [Brassicogethes aeneus]